jgi:hypothetical protein
MFGVMSGQSKEIEGEQENETPEFNWLGEELRGFGSAQRCRVR